MISKYTTNRPLYERLYITGPTGYAWTGACEVDDTEQAYKRRHRWPSVVDEPTLLWVRFDRHGGSSNTHRLQELLASGHWQPALDPALAISEGL